MKLTFADEFNSLNLYSRWKPHDQWGNRTLPGNKELQLYVDPKFKGLGLNPFSVNDGILNIKASKAGGNASKIGKSYTSGMLSSHGAGGFSQKYGYFEIRAQLPAGKGMWPAFWMLADHGKWPPELDIMESIGSNKNYAVQSIHSKGGNKGKTTWTTDNLQTGFHTYGMNWTKNSITYYIDGKQTASYATPHDMHSKMHMLLNIAVGGKWPGSPNSSTDWSKTNFKIDYVRAYSGDPNAKPAPSSPSPSNPPPTSSGGNNNGNTGGNSGGNSGSGSGSGIGDVILSNKINSANLSDHFKAGGGKSTNRTYSAGQMAINGVRSPTNVTVNTNAERDITVTNNGAWGAIKNATVKTSNVDDVTLRNFVATDINLSTATAGRTINISGAKRGTVALGSGADAITVSGHSNANELNLMTINAGSGNDRVSYTGEADNRVLANGGGGNDTITISGKAAATVNGGAGNDRINHRTGSSAKLAGGTGRDVFSFIAGAHATITDFKSSDDRIQLSGIKASSVRVRSSGGNTLIDLGNSGRITVSGASHTANGLHLSYT
jgi:serralysin